MQVLGPGADNPSLNAIAAKLPLRPGDRLNHAAYEDHQRGDLTRTAATLGYLDAKLTGTNWWSTRRTIAGERGALVLETGFRYRFMPPRSSRASSTGTCCGASCATTRTTRSTPRSCCARSSRSTTASTSRPSGCSRATRTARHVVPVNIRAEPTAATAGPRFGCCTDTGCAARSPGRTAASTRPPLPTELQAAQIEPVGRGALPDPDRRSRARSCRSSSPTARRPRRPRHAPPTSSRASSRRSAGCGSVLFTGFRRTTTIIAVDGDDARLDRRREPADPGISYASVPRAATSARRCSRARFTPGCAARPRRSARPANYCSCGSRPSASSTSTPLARVRARPARLSLISDTGDLPAPALLRRRRPRRCAASATTTSPRDVNGINVGGRAPGHRRGRADPRPAAQPRRRVFSDVGNAFDRFGDPLQYSVGIGVRLRGCRS